MAVAVEDLVKVWEGVSVQVAVGWGVPEGEKEGDVVAETERLGTVEAEKVVEGEREKEGVGLARGVTEGEALRVGVGLTVRDGEGLLL